MKQKNSIIFYICIWVFVVILFNFIVYLFNRNTIINCYDYVPVTFQDGSTGAKAVFNSAFSYLLKGYIIVIVSYVLQLIFSLVYLNREAAKKDFFNYSVFGICMQGLIITFFASVVYVYNKLTPIVCLIIFVIITLLTIIRIIFSKVAATIVTAGDENQRRNLMFVETLRGKSLILLDYSTTDNEKKLAKQIVESIKFSDPVSIPELYSIENEMIDIFDEVFEALKSNNESDFEKKTNEFLIKIKERNNDVKRLK